MSKEWRGEVLSLASFLDPSLARNFDPEYLTNLADYYRKPCQHKGKEKMRHAKTVHQLALFTVGCNGGTRYWDMATDRPELVDRST